MWTFCGLPALTMPLLEGEAGLPVGVQLVGSANGDDRLLRTARWLLEHLRGALAGMAEQPSGENRMSIRTREIVMGLVGFAALAVFILGLAHSISTGFAGFWGGLPFVVIVVLSMAAYDYWDECLRPRRGARTVERHDGD